MIVLVNLMVAQMTTSFEAIKQASSVFRLFERVRTIIEYKDDTGLPSPFNLIAGTVGRCLVFANRYLAVPDPSRPSSGQRGFATLLSPEECRPIYSTMSEMRAKYVKDVDTAEAEQLGDKVTGIVKQLDAVGQEQAALCSRLRRIERAVLR